MTVRRLVAVVATTIALVAPAGVAVAGPHGGTDPTKVCVSCW